MSDEPVAPVPTGISSGLQVPNKPQDFGYLGWTVDPLGSGNAQALTTQVIYLVRFRAVASGPCGHFGYSIGAGGAGITAGQSFVGIYDTGQIAAGFATLLATSADQSGVWTAAGTYNTALTSPAVLVAGQDYFAAFVCGFTVTSPTFLRITGTVPGLENFNLPTPGLSLRTALDAGPNATLPATIAAAAIVSPGAFPLVAIMST